ncbi:MAG: CPBP family intramembrane glutamic endopeptidase [Candidatus Omnitrophota bacterium]
MNSPTLYLDVLILLASVHPSGFSFAVRSVLERNGDETINRLALMYLSIPFFLLLPMIGVLKKDLYFISVSSPVFYLLALLFIPGCIFLEYGLNRIYLYVTTGKKYKGLTLHADWKSHYTVLSLLLISFVAIGEEFIFRQCWFFILAKTFSLPVGVIILITSLIYALNHLHYGIHTVLSKFVSGSIYGSLYVWGGYNILLPMVTHVFQNLALIGIGRNKNG